MVICAKRHWFFFKKKKEKKEKKNRKKKKKKRKKDEKESEQKFARKSVLLCVNYYVKMRSTSKFVMMYSWFKVYMRCEDPPRKEGYWKFELQVMFGCV